MAEEHSIKILVVDDEPSVLESFKMILQIKDYDVTAVLDGMQAIQAIQQNSFDMAFVDLRLPGMDGIEVLQAIKKEHPNTEVIIVTAYASEESQANAITFGALDYIRKPFLMEEIYNLVDRALRKRREKAQKKPGAGPDVSKIH